MDKFAGFLKRAKKIAGKGMNVLNTVNYIYKGVKPFVEPNYIYIVVTFGPPMTSKHFFI